MQFGQVGYLPEICDLKIVRSELDAVSEAAVQNTSRYVIYQQSLSKIVPRPSLCSIQLHSLLRSDNTHPDPPVSALSYILRRLLDP